MRKNALGGIVFAYTAETIINLPAAAKDLTGTGRCILYQIYAFIL